jgi:hypothetical protein
MDCVFVVVAGFGVSEERTHTKRGFFGNILFFETAAGVPLSRYSPLSKLAFLRDVASRALITPRRLPRART